ncbi:penicillin-binding protein 1C [Piscinibacter defluvii]|uniref:penicillin-binding protein 1C n=1 Tax=Piscinibacter defluvii TaxID=1796922 RepID=UPI000FDE1375|nr:penicillin-binding protein 1C [Piscinibacter defluvii]
MCATVVLCAAAVDARAVPSFAEVRAAHRPSDLTLLDRRGEPIQTLRVDDTVRRLPWVPLEHMSPALRNAIVLSEDRRFWQHGGIDWRAVAASAWANTWNTRTRGASTLTMQLAGLLEAGLARPAGGRSVAQKIGQAVTALQLERAWQKSEILEAYLNSVPLRGELVGIGALSQTLFGKHASGLDEQEAAITAVLVRAPNAPPAQVAQRACGLLTAQRLGCTGVEALALTALARPGGMPLGEQLAPHVARKVIDPAGPAEQRSTLDARLQRFAIAALRTQLAELRGRQVEDGAVVVLDNASGAVLAWVGANGTTSAAAQVDGVTARRQPGSTIKPFVYGLAFEKRLITPASLLDDSPAQLGTAHGLYLPQNYDRDFKGWVSARTALGASLNVPAVRVGAMLGPDAVFERLVAFGLAPGESAGFHGHALALGSADVTLLALTNAYRALANGGVWSAPSLTGEPMPKRRVADAAAVHLVTDVLADNNARALTFGLDSQLATRSFAAVKTGTSKDLRDNWCVGFTERYTVGVWVGNASGAAMHEVSGVSGAAPLWHALVTQLHAGRPSKPPVAPAGVLRQAVRFEGAAEAAREELFVAGTEQAVWRAGAAMGAPRRFGILNPRDGSRFALDPDIPPRAQQIVFEGEAGTWVLDGRVLGRGEKLPWAPWPGRHRLELRGAGGRVLEAVQFEVRGAGLRRGAAASSPTSTGTSAPSPRR